MLTQRGEVQEAGEDDSPEVGGVDDVTSVDLEAEQPLDIRRVDVASNKELTRRPSASQLFKVNITPRIRPRGVP